jgi:post-segregation antitoxin (ccd killing protein)
MVRSTRVTVRIQLARDAYELARGEAERSHLSVSRVVERAILAELGGVTSEAGVEMHDARASIVAVAVTSIRALVRLAGVHSHEPASDVASPADAGRVHAKLGDEKLPRVPDAASPLYYSLEALPPKTSERAFRRALKAGLPVTRVGYAEVVTPSAWVAWIERNAQPRARAARAALPARPTDDELLATVATRRTKR